MRSLNPTFPPSLVGRVDDWDTVAQSASSVQDAANFGLWLKVYGLGPRVSGL